MDRQHPVGDVGERSVRVVGLEIVAAVADRHLRQLDVDVEIEADARDVLGVLDPERPDLPHGAVVVGALPDPARRAIRLRQLCPGRSGPVLEQHVEPHGLSGRVLDEDVGPGARGDVEGEPLRRQGSDGQIVGVAREVSGIGLGRVPGECIGTDAVAGVRADGVVTVRESIIVVVDSVVAVLDEDRGRQVVGRTGTGLGLPKLDGQDDIDRMGARIGPLHGFDDRP